jgi:hypothetical protein
MLSRNGIIYYNSLCILFEAIYSEKMNRSRIENEQWYI